LWIVQQYHLEIRAEDREELQTEKIMVKLRASVNF